MGEIIKNEFALLFWEFLHNGDPRDIQTIINAGADVHARDKAGRTPLMWIASKGNNTPQVVQILIDGGSDVHARDNLGCNPMKESLALTSLPLSMRA